MAITAEGLLNLVSQERQKSEQIHAEETAAREAKYREKFKNFFVRDIWTMLKIDPDEVPFKDGHFYVQTQVIVNDLPIDLSLTYNYANGSGLQIYSPGCVVFYAKAKVFPHDNALALGRALSHYLKMQPSLRYAGVIEFRSTLAQARSMDELAAAAGLIEVIPHLTDTLRAELTAEFMAARAGFSDLEEQRRAVAGALRDLAAIYVESSAAIAEAQREWAERWTKQLWHPWVVWRVTYTAMTRTQNADEVLMTVHVLEHPKTLARKLPPLEVSAVSETGEVTKMWIGPFVNAMPQVIEKGSIDRSLPFHRHFYAGAHVVNVPANVDVDPGDPAPEQVSFEETLAGCEQIQGVTLPALDPYALVGMEVEEIARLVFGAPRRNGAPGC